MDHRRMFCLLLLVLFQPAFTRAGCSVTSTVTDSKTIVDKYGYYRTERTYKYSLKCILLTSLHTGVPLTTYMTSDDVSEATEAQSIEFSLSTINTVPVGVFHAFNAAETLSMNNVSINSISPGAFSGMTQLQELFLNYNNISELEAGTFDGLDQLTRLEMSGNKLTTLKSLNRLAKLELLTLNSNDIETIDDAFLELRNLTKVTMSNNRITTIPIGTFRNLAKLITLDLSYNNLMDLKFGVFTGLTNLHELDVSNNKIARLESKVLFPLKSLTQLTLDGNLLRTFDADTMASHLTTLESISLDRNQMQCEWLTSCINVFTLHNITVLVGDSFKTSNVHGIYCVGENEHGNVTIPTTAVVSNTTVGSNTTIVPTVAVVPNTTLVPKAGDTISKNLRTDQEKTNDLLAELLKANSNTFFLLIVLTVAVIVLIVIILAISLFIMYSIKHINMKDKRGKSSASCGVELLHRTD